MVGEIIEECIACLSGVGGSSRLFGGNGVECHEHRVVDGPCVIEEHVEFFWMRVICGNGRSGSVDALAAYWMAVP